MDYTELTAQRLRLAMEAAGFNQSSLADAWKEYNTAQGWEKGKGLPITRKTIGEWIEKGIPVKSFKLKSDDPVGQVASFFRITKEEFLEESGNWSLNSFQVLIRSAFQVSSTPKKEGVMSVLSDIIELTETKNLERVFFDYKGFYFSYFNWIKWGTTRKPHEPQSSI